MPSIISATTTSGLTQSADNSGVLALQTNNGTTAVTIDTSQNVGIGTASPAAKLDARGNALFGANGRILLTESSGDAIIGGAAGTNFTDMYVNGALNTRFNLSGSLVLKGGATGATGTGIAFPATQSASSDANTLDDYEEGTWTPAIKGSTTAGTASYSNNAGRYTKIGRQVFVEAYIDWFSGTGTGNLQIGNLPFAATNADFYRPGISIGYLNNVALTASNIATGWIEKNASFIDMQQYPVGGGAATDVAYDISGRISFGAVYTI